jgi:predicted metalloenzyme YecM
MAVQDACIRTRSAAEAEHLPHAVEKTEEFLKANIHNVRQCCYLTYTEPELVKRIGFMILSQSIPNHKSFNRIKNDSIR